MLNPINSHSHNYHPLKSNIIPLQKRKTSIVSDIEMQLHPLCFDVKDKHLWSLNFKPVFFKPTTVLSATYTGSLPGNRIMTLSQWSIIPNMEDQNAYLILNEKTAGSCVHIVCKKKERILFNQALSNPENKVKHWQTVAAFKFDEKPLAVSHLDYRVQLCYNESNETEIITIIKSIGMKGWIALTKENSNASSDLIPIHKKQAFREIDCFEIISTYRPTSGAMNIPFSNLAQVHLSGINSVIYQDFIGA